MCAGCTAEPQVLLQRAGSELVPALARWKNDCGQVHALAGLCLSGHDAQSCAYQEMSDVRHAVATVAQGKSFLGKRKFFSFLSGGHLLG